MGRLVDVVRGAGGERRDCAREKAGEIPLLVEEQLTFSLALDHAGDSQTGVVSTQDREAFLRSYRTLTRAEVESSLTVRSEEVSRTVTALVSCLGCRKAVESLRHDIAHHGQQVGRLTVSSSGDVRIPRDQVGERNLASILSTELGRAEREAGEGRRGRGKGRCSLHSLETKRLNDSVNWGPTWDCMNQKCQEEVVLLPFLSVRKNLDSYLKRHKFCSDCTFMVNRAYFFLMSEGELKVKVSPGGPSQKLMEDYVNLCPGISACPLVKYIYVKPDKGFIGDLYSLIEPELCGLSDTRHAKTLEQAQKEVLIVIGLTLFERFRKIQQKLEEAEQNYNLLNFTLLHTENQL